MSKIVLPCEACLDALKILRPLVNPHNIVMEARAREAIREAIRVLQDAA